MGSRSQPKGADSMAEELTVTLIIILAEYPIRGE